MTLENTKFIEEIKKPENFLRIFLALVFLSAGLYRIIYPEAADFEFSNLQLPILLSPFMIIFEIGTALLLLFNRYTRQIYYLLIFFMAIILTWSLSLNAKQLFKSAGELFVFDLNPTDFFLHFVFLLVVLTLLRIRK